MPSDDSYLNHTPEPPVVPVRATKRAHNPWPAKAHREQRVRIVSPETPVRCPGCEMDTLTPCGLRCLVCDWPAAS
jgi:hypothetical protein